MSSKDDKGFNELEEPEKAPRLYFDIVDTSEKDPYCDFHEVPKNRMEPPVVRDGALYTLSDDYWGVFCPYCFTRVTMLSDTEPKPEIFFGEAYNDIFDRWDNGKEDTEMFEFVVEQEEMEQEDIKYELQTDIDKDEITEYFARELIDATRDTPIDF